jgi:hypothetical protein
MKYEYFYKLKVALLLLLLCASCAEDEKTVSGPETYPYAVLEEGNANMPSSGVLVAEFTNSPAGFDITKIADNNPSTSYLTPHARFYLLWNGNKSVAINYYTLTSSGDAQANDPKAWTLYGSNDNKTWTPLDRQADQVFAARKEQKTYRFDNSVDYRYVKLSIEANNGGSATQIAEWTLEGKTFANIDDLMAFASGNTHVESTPMGNHYANKHVTTDADKVWLADPANEPNLLPQSPGLSSMQPFTVENLFPFAGRPSPADVNQHGIGDCSALAVFGCFAYMYPDFVKSLITDNRNQTYTVHMFDPQGKRIDVTVQNTFLVDGNGNIGTVTGKNNRITWATILEKAIMKWNFIYGVNPDINGIGSEHVVPLFTGNGDSFAFSPGSLTPEQLTRAVKACLENGKIVVGGFRQSGVKIGNLETVSGHAYTFMYSTEPTAMFTMRNPWGFSPGSDGKEDGVLNIVNDGVVPPLIDLRIIEPGAAADTPLSALLPYRPPVF